ncbi:radical SAM/SPASM domain-containing protein [Listeria seeligeri]|uniref:radical SAM/SPASM domain-containing protein n=1 Tax=Listeria seeligeri TaxID=1640 RepID=UPI0016292731|nr:radical SAM protein [Listeria seeligeri]MBC1932218.1 radical SAM protein [Listeria seeligeri]
MYYNYSWIFICDKNRCYILNRLTKEKIEINQDMFTYFESIYKKEKIDLEILTYGDEFYKTLERVGILSKEKKDDYCDVMKVNNEANYLKRVFIEVTNKCNEFCEHCYNSSSKFLDEKLEIDSLKKLIDESHDMGAYEFQITGGEPMLYRHIEELLDHLWHKGFAITINTNLTILNKKILKKIVQYGVNVNFSLDFSESKKHDKFRGLIGAFDATIKNYHILKENGIKTRVNVMLDNKSDKEIERLINYIKEDLESGYVADYSFPTGRAENMESKFFDDRSQRLYGYINSLANTCSKCYISNENINNLDTENLQFYDCGIGREFIFVNAKGEYALCPSLAYNEEFLIGKNINTTCVRSAWQMLSLKYKNQMRCKSIDNCEFKDICKGGCRSRAYHSYGEITEIDPLACGLYGADEYNKRRS